MIKKTPGCRSSSNLSAKYNLLKCFKNNDWRHCFSLFCSIYRLAFLWYCISPRTFRPRPIIRKMLHRQSSSMISFTSCSWMCSMWLNWVTCLTITWAQRHSRLPFDIKSKVCFILIASFWSYICFFFFHSSILMGCLYFWRHTRLQKLGDILILHIFWWSLTTRDMQATTRSRLRPDETKEKGDTCY